MFMELKQCHQHSVRILLPAARGRPQLEKIANAEPVQS
jgi:hypothetical protein